MNSACVAWASCSWPMDNMIRFEFDSEKALEALVYVVHRTRDHDMYRCLKTLYAADKLHLGSYGRFIYGETHCALEHGAVPSAAYDAVKALSNTSAETLPGVREALRRDGNRLFATRDADLDVLSKSDVECLDAAIRDFQYDTFSKLKAKTHDAAYNATPRNSPIKVESIIEAMPEPRRKAVRTYLEA